MSDSQDDAPDSEEAAKRKMMNAVAERGHYWYDYSEYLFITLMNAFCCCVASRSNWLKRRQRKLRRHEKASERLGKEVDVVMLMQTQRLVSLMARLTLKKHQRALVSNFRQYQINDLSPYSSKGEPTVDPRFAEITFSPSASLLSPSIQGGGNGGTVADESSTAKILANAALT